MLAVHAATRPGGLWERSVVAPATAGHAATVTLDPARLGANGCRGSLSARVTELESAARAEGTMCPQLVRRVGVVARGRCRVTD
jgi:hypothetical protein